MNSRKLLALGAIAALLGCLAIPAFPAPAIAAPATLTFKEPEKGATFAFVDNPPKSKYSAGVPTKFSAGDEFLFTNPLVAEGKRVGKIRASCVATEPSSPRSFPSENFLCTALAKVPGGTLVLVPPLSNHSGGGEVTEGAVTGGTGKYIGARGTFIITEGRGFTTNTITLLE